MKKILSILILVLCVTQVDAQTEADFFHKAADAYLNEKTDVTRRILEDGIAQFPHSSSLKEFMGLLEEEEKQQQDQQKQQQKEQNEQENEPKKEEDTKQPPEQKEPSNDDAEALQPQPQEPQEGEMSEEDAKRILDALQDEEKDLQKKLRRMPGKRKRVARDW